MEVDVLKRVLIPDLWAQELVELLPSLDVHVALGLMLAIWPLCRKQRAVKEQLIMVLRKAMFRPDVGARLLAVRGFLFLVLQELQTTVRIDDCAQSSSQVSFVDVNLIFRYPTMMATVYACLDVL